MDGCRHVVSRQIIVVCRCYCDSCQCQTYYLPLCRLRKRVDVDVLTVMIASGKKTAVMALLIDRASKGEDIRTDMYVHRRIWITGNQLVKKDAAQTPD